MTQGQDFQSTAAAGAANVQAVVTNLQNLVLAVNALTSQLKTQFGVDQVYTVSTLPSVGSPSRAFVSDSTVAASGHFGATVVGSGTYTVPVFYDNLTWKIG